MLVDSAKAWARVYFLLLRVSSNKIGWFFSCCSLIFQLRLCGNVWSHFIFLERCCIFTFCLCQMLKKVPIKMEINKRKWMSWEFIEYFIRIKWMLRSHIVLSWSFKTSFLKRVWKFLFMKIRVCIHFYSFICFFYFNKRSNTKIILNAI